MAKSSQKKHAEPLDSAQDATQSSGEPAKPRRKRGSRKSPSETKATRSGKAPKRGSKKRPRTISWVKFVIACLAIAAALLVYFFDISRVRSNDMMPTLSKGDLVLSFAPGWISPELTPGQIALLRNDTNEAAPNYLRVLANAGEAVTFESDRIAINGTAIPRIRLTNAAIARPVDEPEIWRENVQGHYYKISLPQQPLAGTLSGTHQLTAGQYFLAGDNRMASYDSRQSGPADKTQIRGHALIILESMRDDGVLGHWLKLLDL